MRTGNLHYGAAFAVCALLIPECLQAAPSRSEAITALERGDSKSIDPSAKVTLGQRMQTMSVPGLSLAVIDGCRIAWAKGYGFTVSGGTQKVTTRTLFQAASISKTLTAIAALRDVQAGKLSLDAPINSELKSWTLTAKAGIDANTVTLRTLLSHTGGTTVEGFPGYAENQPLPSLDNVLNGVPPATTPAVTVEKTPGAQIAYSGGGYAVVQKLLEDVNARPFSRYLDEAVLQPAHMTHSRFAPLSRDTRQAANGHDATGMAIPGRWHQYPEEAAAGLWTTPSDLALFAMNISRSFNGSTGGLITPAMTKEALRPQSAFPRPFGLGFRIARADNGDTLFFHTGANEGYRAIFVMDANTCQGAVVMTNGENGTALWTAVLKDIGRIYGWKFISTLVG